MIKRYQPTNSMICFVAFVIIFTATVTKGNDSLMLENSRLALNVGTDDGAIRSMYDKGLDMHYELKGLAFEFSTNDGAIKDLTPKDIQQSPDKIILKFETQDFTIDLFYTLDTSDGFVEKWENAKKR